VLPQIGLILHDFLDHEKAVIEKLFVARRAYPDAFPILVVAQENPVEHRPEAEVDRAAEQRVNFRQVDGILEQHVPLLFASGENAHALGKIDLDRVQGDATGPAGDVSAEFLAEKFVGLQARGDGFRA
jgi:hypothetical protein